MIQNKYEKKTYPQNQPELQLRNISTSEEKRKGTTTDSNLSSMITGD